MGYCDKGKSVVLCRRVEANVGASLASDPKRQSHGSSSHKPEPENSRSDHTPSSVATASARDELIDLAEGSSEGLNRGHVIWAVDNGQTVGYCGGALR